MLEFEIMDKALKELGVKRYGGLTFLMRCQYDIKMLSLDNLPRGAPYTSCERKGNPLPDFIRWRTKYESVNYGISNY